MSAEIQLKKDTEKIFRQSVFDLAEGLADWIGLGSAVDKLEAWLVTGNNYEVITRAMQGYQRDIQKLINDLSSITDTARNELERMLTEKPLQNSPMIQRAISSHNKRMKQLQSAITAADIETEGLRRKDSQVSSDLLDTRNRHDSLTYQQVLNRGLEGDKNLISKIERGVNSYVQQK